MLRILIVLTTCLVSVLVATATEAQTKPTAPTQATAPTQSTTTTQAAAPTSNPNQGTFDKLSPGNQKIVNALCNAQQGGCPTSSGGTTLTKDQIAVMKQHKGFGVIFKDMQKNGQIPPDVKNLGELVSGKYHPQSATSGGTTITSGSGRSQVVGNQGKSGKGHFDDDASAGGQGSSYRDNSGRGSFSSGSGGPGNSGHSGGRGK